MSSLTGKFEIEVEIQSSPEKYFHTYRHKAHLVPKSCEENLHGVEFHEGYFESTVAVKQWTYNLEGKVQTVKGRIEVDEGNKKVTSTTIEGEILDKFKSFIVTFHVVPKGEGENGGIVKWTWEYEKVSEDIPEPTKFKDLAINVTKDVDAFAFAN